MFAKFTHNHWSEHGYAAFGGGDKGAVPLGLKDLDDEDPLSDQSDQLQDTISTGIPAPKKARVNPSPTTEDREAPRCFHLTQMILS